MPVVKVFADRSLTPRAEAEGARLIEAISGCLVRHLKAQAEKCQVMIVGETRVSTPYPVYVEIHFRASPERDATLVSAALGEMATLIEEALGMPVRLRAFAVDAATLAALDHAPRGTDS